MTGNFIIYYNGREGSTAIVNALSGQTGVRVPLVEDLDAYKFLSKYKARDIPQTLDEIFTTGIYKNADINPAHLQPRQTDTPTRAIGFKWRIFGDIERISRVLTKHDVIVFSLHRRRFLDIVCSTYVHIHGNKLQSSIKIDPHPHFGIHKLDPEALKARNTALSAQEFAMVQRWFLQSAYTQVKTRRGQAAKLRQLARAGVTVKTIYYEDYCADPEKFIKGLLAETGTEITGFNPHNNFIKVHSRPLSARIRKLERATHGWSGAPYRWLEARNTAAISQISRLAVATPR